MLAELEEKQAQGESADDGRANVVVSEDGKLRLLNEADGVRDETSDAPDSPP
jgi:hypothetical protein